LERVNGNFDEFSKDERKLFMLSEKTRLNKELAAVYPSNG